MKYDSKAETSAAATIAALGGRRCTSFAPLTSQYQDAESEELTGKPDFVIDRPHGPVFIDLKAGALNNHCTRASSRAALAREYMYILGRCPDGMSHAELSSALYDSGGRAGYLATLEHAFNHSLWKLAALQAQHGWRHFIVCFEKNPKPADAERYCAAGLIFCTLKTLPQFLLYIELAASGLCISFAHTTTKFSYKVEFDNGTATPAEARSHFLATVDATKAAAAAQEAKDAADFAAGITPF